LFAASSTIEPALAAPRNVEKASAEPAAFSLATNPSLPEKAESNVPGVVGNVGLAVDPVT
jgi:hypothetical protein